VEFGVRHGEHDLDASLLERLHAGQHANVLQQSDEAPAAFALRAARRAEQLVSAGFALRAGVIVTNDETDEASFAARCRIARAMIRAMKSGECAEVVFRASETLSADGRHELFAIAGTLAAQLRGMPIEILVRFDRRSATSDVFPRPIASTAERLALTEVDGSRGAG
jgi:hypothetical protein